MTLSRLVAATRNPAEGSCLTLSQRTIAMTNLINTFIKNESGATAIEYGLIASLVAVAAIGAMSTVGSKLTSTFKAVSAKLK